METSAEPQAAAHVIETPAGKPPGSWRSRLSAERERELLEATLALVAERGYAQVTMQAIATTARCSTATLYRRWSNKADIVAAAFEQRQATMSEHVDTGALRTDLEVLCDHLRGALLGLPALTQHVLDDRDLCRVIHESLFHTASRSLRGILDRHMAAGEIAADNRSLELIDDLLFGLALVDRLRPGRSPDRSRQFIDSVLLPLLTFNRRAEFPAEAGGRSADGRV